MILKPAEYGAETPWHQDEAYMDPTWETGGLSIWMPLDAATVDSGCLHFVPGSHLGGVVTHSHIRQDRSVRGLTTDRVDPAQAVAAPIPAGAATVHDCRTLHGNISGCPTPDRRCSASAPVTPRSSSGRHC